MWKKLTKKQQPLLQALVHETRENLRRDQQSKQAASDFKHVELGSFRLANSSPTAPLQSAPPKACLFLYLARVLLAQEVIQTRRYRLIKARVAEQPR